MIDETVGRIEVLGRFLVVRHRATSVTDDAVVTVTDGNHNASTEEVIITIPFLRMHDETHLLKQFVREGGLFRIVDEIIPRIIGKAYPAFFDELLAPSIASVRVRNTSLIVVLVDIRNEVLLDVLISGQHGFALLVLFLLFRRAFAGIFLYGDVVLIRKNTNGFREVNVLFLLHKGDGITAFATAETVPHIARDVDVERRRFFVMERTATFEAAASWLQGDIIRDNVFDIHLCMNKFECTIRNHIKLRY